MRIYKKVARVFKILTMVDKKVARVFKTSTKVGKTKTLESKRIFGIDCMYKALINSKQQ
jgi:hypothetical protein